VSPRWRASTSGDQVDGRFVFAYAVKGAAVNAAFSSAALADDRGRPRRGLDALPRRSHSRLPHRLWRPDPSASSTMPPLPAADAHRYIASQLCEVTHPCVLGVSRIALTAARSWQFSNRYFGRNLGELRIAPEPSPSQRRANGRGVTGAWAGSWAPRALQRGRLRRDAERPGRAPGCHPEFLDNEPNSRTVRCVLVSGPVGTRSRSSGEGWWTGTRASASSCWPAGPR
jgi:hypothetical protein